MKQNEKNSYQSPVTEVYKIEIEQVLCESSGTWNMENIGDEKEAIDW